MNNKDKLTGLSEEERKLFEQHVERHTPPLKPNPKPAGKRSTSRQSLQKQVKRGTVNVDATIDLHGKTLERAWQDLDQFLTRALPSRWSVVRVITGKGYRSDGGKGVLVQEIPERLRNDDRVKEVIQAVKPKDGGSGAWFVRII